MNSEKNTSIRYETRMPNDLGPEAILELFHRAGISKPGWTAERMKRALNGSSIVVSAWDDSRLIGFSNAITDFSWIAYLSQLAVDSEYQGQGIGRRLLALVREGIGEEVTLVVHSAESASEFYQRSGFKPYSNVFQFPRQR